MVNFQGWKFFSVYIYVHFLLFCLSTYLSADLSIHLRTRKELINRNPTKTPLQASNSLSATAIVLVISVNSSCSHHLSLLTPICNFSLSLMPHIHFANNLLALRSKHVLNWTTDRLYYNLHYLLAQGLVFLLLSLLSFESVLHPEATVNLVKRKSVIPHLCWKSP